jgi:2-iminobutanoate/2-iminopropanoate deaminase
MKQQVTTAKAPAPAGPYSQGVVTGGRMLYVSGQGPVDTATGTFVTETFEQQARLTLKNLAAVVEAGGGLLARAVKVHVYLSDMDDFAELNRIYAEVFPEPRPARTTVQSNLPGFAIEVDAVIALDDAS